MSINSSCNNNSESVSSNTALVSSISSISDSALISNDLTLLSNYNSTYKPISIASMNIASNSLDAVTNSLMGKKVIQRLSEQYLKVDCINKNLILENRELKNNLDSILNKLNESNIKLDYLTGSLPNNMLLNEHNWPNILTVTELKDTIACVEKGLFNLRKLVEDKLEKNFSTQCVICQCTMKNCLLIPCSHISTCYGCSTILLKCPICRSKINQCVKVYLS